MEINAKIYQSVDIDPIDVIEALKEKFLGDHMRWVEKKDKKFFIMENSYHNSSTEVRYVSEEEVTYLNALKIIEKYLKKNEK